MISSRPTIPLLVHEDCMEGVQLDLAKQQASLSKIENDTGHTAGSLFRIEDVLRDIDAVARHTDENTSSIESNTSSIKTSSSNAATAASSLYSSVGTTADEASANTVIGLLKSIANKL